MLVQTAQNDERSADSLESRAFSKGGQPSGGAAQLRSQEPLTYATRDNIPGLCFQARGAQNRKDAEATKAITNCDQRNREDERIHRFMSYGCYYNSCRDTASSRD